MDLEYNLQVLQGEPYELINFITYEFGVDEKNLDDDNDQYNGNEGDGMEQMLYDIEVEIFMDEQMPMP